jgi:hypothetical protein
MEVGSPVCRSTPSCSPLTYKIGNYVLSRLFVRNVPGVALYLTLLQRVRCIFAESHYFQKYPGANSGSATSALPVLTSQGNLLAGATARVSIGTILNPISIVKARYEVRSEFSPTPQCDFVFSCIERFAQFQEYISGVWFRILRWTQGVITRSWCFSSP